MIDNTFNRDGFYLIPPTARTILDCVFVPAEVEPPLSELQRHVGGYIEYVSLPSGAIGWVNEEGKLKGLPFNPLATALYANPSDSICGTMVVCCGKARDEGDAG